MYLSFISFPVKQFIEKNPISVSSIYVLYIWGGESARGSAHKRTLERVREWRKQRTRQLLFYFLICQMRRNYIWISWVWLCIWVQLWNWRYMQLVVFLEREVDSIPCVKRSIWLSGGQRADYSRENTSYLPYIISYSSS